MRWPCRPLPGNDVQKDHVVRIEVSVRSAVGEDLVNYQPGVAARNDVIAVLAS